MPTAPKLGAIAQAAVIPVAAGESPWTAEELAEVRAELIDDVARLEHALSIAQAGLNDLFAEGGETGGRDATDVGTIIVERDQELSVAQNARDMLDQARLALRVFDAGDYGVCSSCGQPIGKDRLQVFPRATLCLDCKQREERR